MAGQNKLRLQGKGVSFQRDGEMKFRVHEAANEKFRVTLHA
jgi:hypothetical protein